MTERPPHIPPSEIERAVPPSGFKKDDGLEKKQVSEEGLERKVDQLRNAHAAWESLPSENRPRFTGDWLSKNGFSGLKAWMHKNGGVSHFASLAGPRVARDFYYNAEMSDVAKRGRSDVPSLLRRYLSEPEPRTEFKEFLNKVFTEQSLGDEEKNQQVAEVLFGIEKRLDNFREAHEEWEASSKSTGKDFDDKWLKENGYYALSQWLWRNCKTNRNEFAALAGSKIGKDFDHAGQRSYTSETAIEKIKLAHAAWSAIPTEGRSPFNTSWLIRNGYGGASNWMRQHGGMPHFMAVIGGKIEQDFIPNQQSSAPNPDKIKGFRERKKTNTPKTETQDELERLNTQLKEINDELRTRPATLKELMVDIRNGTGEEAQQFESLINILGPARCVDILYKFHPEFRGLQPEYVQSVIADYLGNFLGRPKKFHPEDLRVAAETGALSDITLREGAYEVLREYCLEYYKEQRRTGQTDARSIIEEFTSVVLSQVEDMGGAGVVELVDDVYRYYEEILDEFNKPSNFVDKLSEGRAFPDINQRINMKELEDKGRLLIADRMGMGKSASVIMAKERLKEQGKAGCAIVVIPSNVLDTWQGYLSDDPEQGGYFKAGQAPRVLRLEDPKDLVRLQKDVGQYEYILLSQERLTDKYIDELKKVDYDMLIVDEVHKLKNLKGERSPQLLELAKKVQTPDKYLALLSGTPVPNKIQDVAMILKLLHPDKFSQMDNKELVRQIVYGDLVDLRSLLLPYLQMKEAHEGAEMPPLTEEIEMVELDPLERQAYEVLLEEDELTSTEKLRLLRKFLLNPKLVDASPVIEGAKVKTLRNMLQRDLQQHDKIVVFVNNYIEDVIRGEKSFIADLQIPDGVDIYTIHGGMQDETNDRKFVEEQVNKREGKMVVFISGQASDVGVNLAGADRVIMYNEPWTEGERQQEVARVYRPPHKKPLTSTTLIVPGTIEAGIHEHILKKHRAVEKLLRGIPTTDLEKRMMEEDEDAEDLRVNEDLARYYFSSWNKLQKFFGYAKELGQGEFQKFLGKHGKEYAGGYAELGSRCYQANANRVIGAVIEELAAVDGKDPTEIRILDLASGPEMLKKHIGNDFQPQVISLDINQEHFTREAGDNRVVGSALNVPFASKAFDFVNFSLAFHDLDFAPSKGKYERVQALMEMNRVLKIGGKATVNIMYSVEFKDYEGFGAAIADLGFKIVDQFSGAAEVGRNYKSHLITLEKISDLDEKASSEVVSKNMDKKKRDGLKFVEPATRVRLKDSRRIARNFQLNGREHAIHLNDKDAEVYTEESQIIEQGEKLKRQYGTIDDIPIEVVMSSGFARIQMSQSYTLFKKLTKGPGVVLVK